MKRKTRILIDPGHGGTDPGAEHGGIREADINLTVAQRLYQLLETAGFAPRLTRKDDHQVALEDRAHIEHLTEPDLFVSLHCNSASSPGANGLEIFTSIGKTDADHVAECLAETLEAVFPSTRFRADLSDGDRDKEAGFYVLEQTRCPAVLVEMGFLSNDHERAWLTNPETHEAIAKALCAGLIVWWAEA